MVTLYAHFDYKMHLPFFKIEKFQLETHNCKSFLNNLGVQ